MVAEVAASKTRTRKRQGQDSKSVTIALPSDSTGISHTSKIPSVPCKVKLPGVLVVRSKGEAERTSRYLAKVAKKEPGRVFACDVKVHWASKLRTNDSGYVISFSVYGGADLQFGTNPSDRQHHLWVDTLMNGKREVGTAILMHFLDFFADPAIIKIWHNGPIDKNLLWHELGLDQGQSNVQQKQLCLDGDTMTMARLWGPELYAKLEFQPRRTRWQLLHKLKGGHTGTSTKESKLFGVMTTVSPGNPVGRLDGAVVQKDSAGQIVKVRTVPTRDVLQSSPETRPNWVSYCVTDVQATHKLYGFLQSELKKVPWTTVDTDHGFKILSMFDLYSQIWPLVDNLYGNIKGSARLAKRQPHELATMLAEDESDDVREVIRGLSSTFSLEDETSVLTEQMGNMRLSPGKSGAIFVSPPIPPGAM